MIVTATAVRADDDFKTVYGFSGAIMMGKETIAKNVSVKASLNVYAPNADDGGKTTHLVGIGLLDGGTLLEIPKGYSVHLMLDIANLDIEDIRFSMPTEENVERFFQQVGLAGNTPITTTPVSSSLGKATPSSEACWYKGVKDRGTSRWHLFYDTKDNPECMVDISVYVKHRNNKNYAKFLFFTISSSSKGSFVQPLRFLVRGKVDGLERMSALRQYQELSSNFKYPWSKSAHERMLREKEMAEEAGIRATEQAEAEKVKAQQQAQAEEKIRVQAEADKIKARAEARAVEQAKASTEAQAAREQLRREEAQKALELTKNAKKVTLQSVTSMCLKNNVLAPQSITVTASDVVRYCVNGTPGYMTALKIKVKDSSTGQIVFETIASDNELTICGNVLLPYSTYKIELTAILNGAPPATFPYTITRRR